jgi:hypothetical protein
MLHAKLFCVLLGGVYEAKMTSLDIWDMHFVILDAFSQYLFLIILCYDYCLPSLVAT